MRLLALALTLAGCIHTRTGPHDTPVVDGASADGGRECGQAVELSVDLSRCRWAPDDAGGFRCGQ